MPRTFGLAFVLALTGAIAPGPVLALIIGQVLAQGFGAAMLIVLGHAAVEAVLVVGLAVGLARFLQRPRVRGVASLVGGGVLLWMGWGMAAGAPGISLATAGASAMSWYALVLAGGGISLANPYFTGWWATVGTGQVATLGLRTRADFAAFFVGHEMGDVVWYGFVALVLTGGRGWLSDAVYRWAVWCCGAAILVLGLLFLAYAVRFLIRPPAATAAPAGLDAGAPGGQQA
jgi:threonine/homoserine/homoserine lactone efflux protein